MNRFARTGANTDCGGGLPLAAILSCQLGEHLADGVVEGVQCADHSCSGRGSARRRRLITLAKLTWAAPWAARPLVSERDEKGSAIGGITPAARMAAAGHGLEIVRHGGQRHANDWCQFADGQRPDLEYRAVDRIFIRPQAGVGHRLAEQDAHAVADSE